MKIISQPTEPMTRAINVRDGYLFEHGYTTTPDGLGHGKNHQVYHYTQFKKENPDVAGMYATDSKAVVPEAGVIVWPLEENVVTGSSELVPDFLKAREDLLLWQLDRQYKLAEHSNLSEDHPYSVTNRETGQAMLNRFADLYEKVGIHKPELFSQSLLAATSALQSARVASTCMRDWLVTPAQTKTQAIVTPTNQVSTDKLTNTHSQHHVTINIG